MPRLLEQRIRRLQDSEQTDFLRGGRKGLEKESLRITSAGCIAQTPHPKAWGAPLTHPYITTDYSEALPEFITPAFDDLDETVSFLDDIHRFVYHNLDQSEMLWAASMPCAVSDDADIPIAEYGSSNSGRMKHIYRRGLDARYGRRMQAIAGVHFNYSLPVDFWPVYQELEAGREAIETFISAEYFALIRNFKRLGWMIPFLFGNSPAVCKSFLAGRTTRFRELFPGTFYLPYATSLRMSDIGYKNKNQSALLVSYDNLTDYVDSLTRALHTPYPEYEAIGLYANDERIQLSTNVLQIENEYYSFIRPKRTALASERPTTALGARGVEYVEVRALDVNCLSPSGVDPEQLRFVEAFLIFCLLEESPHLTEKELQGIEYNELSIALRGRDPELELISGENKLKVRNWSLEITDRMRPICEILDEKTGANHYCRALGTQEEAIRHPDQLPAARIIDYLASEKIQYHHYMMALSSGYAKDYRASSVAPELKQKLKQLATESHHEQAEQEAADKQSLDDYIAEYLND